MKTLFKPYSRQLIFSGAFILALLFHCDSHCSQIEISGQITIEKQAFAECPLIVQPQKHEITTDSDGIYHVYLQKGWSGKIVPLLKGFRFFPGFYQYINMQLDLVDQNYETTRLPDDYIYPPQILGPTTGETWEKLNFQIVPSGLKYFYIWSDQQDGEWGSDRETHFWRYPGYYCVRVLAKDDTGRQSDWSNCHLLQIHEDIPGNLPPTKPTVFGAEQGITGIEYSFYANSSDPEECTPLTYQFKTDDCFSDWQLSNTWRHSFDKPGAFIVQAQAKDHLGALSNRSDFHTIHIELAHAPEMPKLILSQYYVIPGLSITARARSIDQDEDHYADRIQYQFDFGDNSQSEWIRSKDQWAYADHSWYTVGTYCVKVVARDDSGLISPVSECREIEVKLPNHPPSIPTITGPEVGYTHTEYTFVVNASDQDGDALEYLLEITTPTNNGVPDFEEIVYDWQESNIFHHAFDIAGTYMIKAAVQEKGTSHPDVLSLWHHILIHSELIVPEIRIQCPTPNYACNNRCNGRYASGESLKIVWKKSDDIDENRMQHVNLFYAIDDTAWIKMGESDTTSFDWDIPDDFLHDHVTIKIVADFAVGSAEVISEPVAFYDARIPDITLSSDSPSVYYMNDPIDIHWQITCAPGYDVKSARLEFHTAGSTRKTIAHLNQTQASEGSYTWIPDNCRYRTNSGQFNLYAICSNCQEYEVWSDTFSIQFQEDHSNPWQKTETAFEITPDPNYFQYLREPDVFVDYQNNIHFLVVYCKTSKGNDPNETQLYYRKKN
ncbi:MAG: hypothetical protein OMM_10068, partial [Candidatus Magnetoglobus multicellularis str. Araruama]